MAPPGPPPKWPKWPPAPPPPKATVPDAAAAAQHKQAPEAAAAALHTPETVRHAEKVDIDGALDLIVRHAENAKTVKDTATLDAMRQLISGLLAWQIVHDQEGLISSRNQVSPNEEGLAAGAAKPTAVQTDQVVSLSGECDMDVDSTPAAGAVESTAERTDPIFSGDPWANHGWDQSDSSWSWGRGGGWGGR